MRQINQKKSILFTCFIILIIITISSVNATIENNNNTITQNNTNISQSTHTPEKIINTTKLEKPNTIENTEKISNKTTKKDPENNTDTYLLDKTNYTEIIIDETNKDEYMDYEFKPNTHIIINGTIKDMYLFIDTENITITGYDNNSQIQNSMIESEESSIHISNITFNSTDESEFDVTLNLLGSNNIIDNVNFYANRNEATESHYREINIENNNNTIHDCYFNIIYPGINIDFDSSYGGERKSNVIFITGDNNSIYNCTMKVDEGVLIDTDYGTLESIDIFGNNNTVTRNTIDMKGTKYLYGIMVFYNNNTITNNNINVVSVRYANGISIDGRSSNCIAENNTINVICENGDLNDSTRDDSAYGIIIIESDYHGFAYNITNSKVSNNILKGNIITGNASQMYGIEQFGGNHTQIIDNYIDINGRSSMAIGVVGTNTTIVNNKVISKGYTSEMYESPDYLRPQTTGIYVYSGHGNYVEGNDIITENGPGIRLDREYNTNVNGNTIINNGYDTAIETIRHSSGSTINGNLISNYNANSIIANDDNVFDNKEITTQNQTQTDEKGEPNSTDIPTQNEEENNQTSTDTPIDDSSDVEATNQTSSDTPVDDSSDVETTNQTSSDTPVDDSSDVETTNQTSSDTSVDDSSDVEDTNQTSSDTPVDDSKQVEPTNNNITINNNQNINQTMPINQITNNTQKVTESVSNSSNLVKTNSSEKQQTSSTGQSFNHGEDSSNLDSSSSQSSTSASSSSSTSTGSSVESSAIIEATGVVTEVKEKQNPLEYLNPLQPTNIIIILVILVIALFYGFNSKKNHRRY